MRICVLSSGSKGNCTVISTDKVNVLIDIGTTCSYVENSLKNNKIECNDIKHILITHNHADHIKGLKVFIKKYNPILHVTKKLKDVLEKEIGKFRYEIFEDRMCIIDDLIVKTIKTSHDADDSVGFIIKHFYIMITF